ncbi:hypothetical protein SLS58_004819 [Diplodia intermedia]|uniref:DNA2/NAM7 helicase-like C-terminal domain-containing protein n=1 Tax=Diplodia intermedia TaxID=856260 RepID=A0ABR3TSC3_9PEZI
MSSTNFTLKFNANGNEALKLHQAKKALKSPLAEEDPANVKATPHPSAALDEASPSPSSLPDSSFSSLAVEGVLFADVVKKASHSDALEDQHTVKINDIPESPGSYAMPLADSDDEFVNQYMLNESNFSPPQSLTGTVDASDDTSPPQSLADTVDASESPSPANMVDPDTSSTINAELPPSPKLVNDAAEIHGLELAVQEIFREQPEGSTKEDFRQLLNLQPQKTPGTRLLCSLWALAGSIASIQNGQEQDHNVIKYHEYLIYMQLRTLLSSERYKEKVSITPGVDVKASHTDFLDDVEVKIVLAMYEEDIGKEFRLGIVVMPEPDNCTIPRPFISKTEPEDAPLVWIMNRWNCHWEAMTPVIRGEDISHTGCAIDLEDEEYADDPRHTGEPPAKIAGTRENTPKVRLESLCKPSDRYSSEWDKIRPSNPFHACQVLPEGSPAFPNIDARNLTQFRAVSITVSAGNLSLAPHIVVKLTVYRSIRESNPQIVWVGKLTIPLGRLIWPKERPEDEVSGHASTRPMSRFTTELAEGTPESPPTHVTASMEFSSAVPSKLDIPEQIVKAQTMTGEELAMFKFFKDLSRGRDSRVLRLKVFFSPHEHDELKAGDEPRFLSLLHQLGRMVPYDKVPWAPYLRKSGYPEIASNSMKLVNVRIEDGSPHMPVDASPELMDAVEAEVTFGYDVDNEAAEEELLLDQYEKSEHTARFVNIGSHVVAIVSFSNLENFYDERHSIEAGSEVEVKFVRSDMTSPQQASFFVSQNPLGLPSANTVLISKFREPKFFGDLAVDLTEIASAVKTPISIRVKRLNISYKRRIDAIHTVWSPKTGRQDLWRLLMNHDPSDLPPIDPFTLAGVDPAKAITHVKNLSHQTLNREQIEVIDSCRSMPAGVQVVQACGGMGKTRMECLIAHIYTMTGITPIVMAPTNSAVDAVCDTYRTIFPDEAQPVRVAASNKDADDIALGRFRPKDETESYASPSQDMVEVEIISSLKTEHSTRRRHDGLSDLLSEVVALAKSGTREVWGWYTDGIDEITQEPINVGDKVDMVAEFNTYLEKAMDPDEPAFSEWDDDDKKRYGQALKRLKADVVSRAPIIACTTVTAALAVVRQNAGVSGTGKVALLLDEAGRDREADTLIPIAKFGDQVVSLHLFGDIKQGGPVCVSSNSTNEFIERGRTSLMERLIEQGLKYQPLLTQYRMHRLLFDFPNRFIYEKKLRTSSTANLPLDKDLGDMLCAILGNKGGDFKQWDKARLQYIQVTDGVLRRSSRSHSRANLQNVEWTMVALEKLQQVLKEETRQRLTILTPYKRQREEYDDRILRLRREKNLTSSEVPQTATIDSYQGHETDIILLDLVNTRAGKAADIGFIKDDRRANVAITRAKKVLWIIGGPFQGRLAELKPKTMDDEEEENPFEPRTKRKLCAILDYILTLRQKNLQTLFDNNILTHPIPQDLVHPKDPVNTGIHGDNGSGGAESGDWDSSKVDAGGAKSGDWDSSKADAGGADKADAGGAESGDWDSSKADAGGAESGDWDSSKVDAGGAEFGDW